MDSAHSKNYDAVVLGGGAAGLMCAAQLGFGDVSVLLLDHANKVGKKILMSGGGRCNFTNYEIYPTNYISKNPHFCKSALSRYTQYDFLQLVERYKIPFHEKTQGQLFCDNKAKDVLNMLLDQCSQASVQIETSVSIESVAYDPKNQIYLLDTTFGAVTCDNLVVATGGLSIPTMGATGFGYDIAQQFGLKVCVKHASLVPFTLGQEYLTLAQSLAGLSLPVNVQVRDASFIDNLLFTHKGLSGPAILQISNYWWPGDAIVIDFAPGISIAQLLQTAQLEKNKRSLQNLLSEHLPKRFVQTWLESSAEAKGLADQHAGQLSHKSLECIAQLFHSWHHTPKGTEGYKTAEVTRGGVDTNDISSKTFEAKKQPGLYFIGEVLDVTGWLGGYNFQWAWASGWCAAQAIIAKVPSFEPTQPA